VDNPLSPKIYTEQNNSRQDKMQHANMKIPQALLDEIERIMEENPQLGYVSSTEFIKEAIRLHLKDYKPKK
jgi:metal-responsive CopG/Arc/MetJ family transcriptional regulator